MCHTGSQGVAADYRVWGSLAQVRAPGANKLFAHTRASVFLGFPLDTSGWQFYDPVTLQFFASQDVTFDESVCYYRSRPHRDSEAFSPPLFLTPDPPPAVLVPPPPPRFLPRQGEGIGATGVGGADSRGVGVEAHLVEDTTTSSWWPRPASPLGFLLVPQFPPSPSLQPVAAEHGGVSAGGTGGTEGFVGGGSIAATAGESRGGVTVATGEGRAEVPATAAGAVAVIAGESRGGVTGAAGEGRAGVLAAPVGAAAAAVGEGRGGAIGPPAGAGAVTADAKGALVTTVTGFASSHRLDYTAHLVSGPARSQSSGGAPVFPLEVLKDRQFELGFLADAVPHLCAMQLAPTGDPKALDIPITRTHAEAISGPWALYWIAAEEAEMASYRSTGTYIDAVPPPGANVVSGMWLYKVQRPLGSPPVLKACYVARGFSQREGVDFFQTFAPTRKMTTLRVLLHIVAHCDYELHSLAASPAWLHWLFPCWDPVAAASTCLWPAAGSPSSRGFASRSPGLAVDHGLMAPPSYEPFESSGPYPELIGCLILGTRAVSWRSTQASCISSSNCHGEVYTAAMAAQEVRWLNFLITDLGERPRSPPVLFVDNRSAEPRLVGKAKHIQLCYFLLRELQQCGHALVRRVVSQANTVDIFTKALPPCDHQRFCTQLGLVPARPDLLT
ncbi:unnamed protein product [Closterium sp. NIES-53]